MPNEQQLSETLRDFARTMVTDFPIQAILDHLVERIVDILPITSAGVTLITPGSDPHYVAASDEAARCYERLQTELGEGPCLAAYDSGEAVAIADLRLDGRFPRYARRAVEEGLAAVFTFPLRHDNEQLGALDLYRDTPGELGANALDAAQTLADVAAAYLLNARARAHLQDTSQRSHHLTLHDALTGLPNRTLLFERLEHAALRGRRSGKTDAVLFVDLDRFKTVNDRHGHSVGDELLVTVAHRLTAVLRPGDTLARISGDEFVVLCEDLDGPAQAHLIAARIGAAVAAPFTLSGAEVKVTASVGIAFPGPGSQPAQLLQDADTAMYQAKRKGGGRHQIVDLRERFLAERRASMEVDLRGAAERGELRTEYQPIVATSTGRITGVEALLRWDHPEQGLVPPAFVVPLAEQCGLIAEIGQWVLQQACPDGQRWQKHLPAQDFTMSVNVSAHQIMAPDFVRTVDDVLTHTATNPELLTLEVTESVLIQDGERALVVLNQLKHLGVHLALDDFGTGFSSLTCLKRFPIDIVKIDKDFVTDIEHDSASIAIVRSVIELAHCLNMTVVAEGVETQAQFEQLGALGSDFCQGYYFARPMTPINLRAFIDNLNDGAISLPTLHASHS